MISNVSARQRTYEAAYWRTALSQFSFAVVVLSIFQSVFYSMGGISLEESCLCTSCLLWLCRFNGIAVCLSTCNFKQRVFQ
jgi:hypothetical protein